MRTIPLSIAAMTLAVMASTAQATTDPLSPIEPDTVVVTARSAAPQNPNIFGTVAINAGVTVYGARWRRVSAADERDPRVLALAAATVRAAPDAYGRLAFVQAAVDQRINWRRDLDTYHISDYWAQAGETLTRAAGDSEDIAILKMQVLKAAGFAPRDIYLSVGRDPQRGADTRLLVRVGDDFYALDDRSPAPLNAAAAGRFEPVITLGRGTAWLHGHHYAGRTPRLPIQRAAFTVTRAR